MPLIPDVSCALLMPGLMPLPLDLPLTAAYKAFIVITGEVKTATGCLSLSLGAVLSFFISVRELGRAGSNTGQGWSHLAPGWRILDPGAHDPHIMLLATVLDAVIYGLVIFTAFYGLVKLVDKLTQ